MTDPGLPPIDHGFIDSQEANARLRPIGVGAYLMRRAKSDRIISYIDEDGLLAHVILPHRHDCTLFVKKPTLTSIEKLMEFLTSLSLRWLTPVSRENNNYQDKDTERDTLTCHVCHKKCRSSKELRAHVNSHRETFCPKCETMVAQRSWSRHKSMCNRDLSCKECPYIGENLINLKQHVRREHSPKKHYKCFKCSKTFQTLSGRSRHFAKCHRDANGNVDKMEVDEKKGPDMEIKDSENSDADMVPGNVDLGNQSDDPAPAVDDPTPAADVPAPAVDVPDPAVNVPDPAVGPAAGHEDEERGRRQARGKRVRPESLSPPPPRKRGRPGGRKPAQCPHCDYLAPSKSKLKRHLRKHSRPKKNTMKIECDNKCGYSSYKRSHVKVHMQESCPERLQRTKRFSKKTLWDLVSSHTVSNRLAFSLLKKVEKSTGVKFMPPYAKKLMSDSLNIFMQDITGEIVNFKVSSWDLRVSY